MWEFLTEHARRKFQISIDRDMLDNIHLNGLLANILDKFGIKLTRSIRDINFSHSEGKFLDVEDIVFVGPTVKDYSELSVQVLS